MLLKGKFGALPPAQLTVINLRQFSTQVVLGQTPLTVFLHSVLDCWKADHASLVMQSQGNALLAGGTFKASILRLPDEGVELQQEAVLEGHEGTIHRVLWHPSNVQLLATIEDASLRIWTTADGGATVSRIPLPALEYVSPGDILGILMAKLCSISCG